MANEKDSPPPETLADLTGAKIQAGISKEFKAGRAAGINNRAAYTKGTIQSKIQASFDSPLVAAYWMGVYWSLTHPEDQKTI